MKTLIGFGIELTSKLSQPIHARATRPFGIKYPGIKYQSIKYQSIKYQGIQTLYTSAGPIAFARMMIAVQASISNATASHNDYQDILTFIATGTF